MAICGKCKAEGVSVDHVRQCYGIDPERPTHPEHLPRQEPVQAERQYERVDIFVSFDDKEEAKKFGAKWDAKFKTWYLPEGVPEGFPAKFLEKKGAARRAEPAEPGFYEKDGEIFKVQLAVHGSGKPYAKRLVVYADEEDGENSSAWMMSPGTVFHLKEEDRLTLERAKELGHLYGICVRCGRTLTDEGSIAAGIGPICAGKGF